jgi:hypothetical protein
MLETLNKNNNNEINCLSSKKKLQLGFKLQVSKLFLKHMDQFWLSAFGKWIQREEEEPTSISKPWMDLVQLFYGLVIIY